MPLVLADRVRETTTTAGTGTVTLAGAVTGYQTFAAVGNGNTTYYCIAGQGTSEWEVGIGTYTSSGTTLSRDTVLASSAGGAKVTFSAGTKDVFVTYPSGKSINEDASDNVGIGTTTPAAKLDIASGNLLFSSTGQRITGDFSNATLANRLLFQTSTSNSSTTIAAIPNGTATASAIVAHNNSDPANSSSLSFLALTAETRITSNIHGTGTYLPMTFYIGGSERVRIDTSGNVAVGTTNAGTAGLSLSQNYNLSWEQSATESISNLFRQTSSAALVMSVGYKRSATANGFASSFGSSLAKTAISLGTTAGAITFYTDAAATAAVGTDVTPTERMRITATGNVGIGTGAPIGPLQVAGAAYFGANSSQTTGTCAIYNDGNNVTIEAFAGNNTATKRDLLLATYGGNVGIGVASPGTRLEVAGGVSAQQVVGRYFGFGTAGFSLDGTTVNDYGITYTQISSTFNTVLAGFSNIKFATGQSEKMRIDSSGNVGIGATPSFKLDVNGGALGTTAGNQVIVERLVTTTSNADSLEFSKIRNTNGTGWETAGWRLQQKVDSTWMGYLQFNGTNNQQGISFGTGNSTVSANSISERMRIDSSGNVGIGTASPGYKLDVNGTAAVRGVLYMANEVWNQTLDGKNRFYFGANSRTYFGSQAGYEWRSSTDTNLAVLENLGFFNVNGPVQSNYTATYGVAKLYMAGGYSQFGKDSGHRTDIVNTGGLDSTSPFWTGYQWCPPDTITNSGGAASFPRTSFYFNYSTVTNPSNMAFNMYVGNNNGIPIGINIGTESAGNINFITSGSTRLTVTSGGNLNFPGTAQRITGDFSNATRNSRVLFQTTTANDATSVGAIPNGTSNVANFGISNSSNPDNAAVCVMSISGSTAGLNSSKIGTGTTLPLVLSVDSVMRLQFNTDGTINSFDSAAAVGYKGVPLNEQAAAYTLVLADQGKTIVHPITDNNARTYTIPANGTVAFPIGTAITFINMINTVTISITTDTMYLAGVGTTGNRTLAAFGMATAVKITSTSWIISGNGLS